MKYSILEISEQNRDVLNNVAIDVFDEDINAEHLREYLEQTNHKMFVAETDNLVVGQVRGMVHYQPDEPPHLYIDNLGVTPDAKRQGIAGALFGALVAWGESQKCEGYWVATECDNDEGNSFYESLGLKPEQMYFYEKS